MATKKERVFRTPNLANEVTDANGRLIGKYIYLRNNCKANDQEILDQFCASWLSTYRSNEKFFLTIDLETTGLDFYNKDAHILLVSISWDGYNSIVFAPREFNLDKFKEVLTYIPISNMNILFDAKWILVKWNVEINIMFDPMTAAQMGYAGLDGTMSFPGYGKPFALSNIVANILPGFKMDKETRNSFIGMDPTAEFDDEQISYAAIDTLLCHRLVYPLTKRLYNNGLLDLYRELEIPVMQMLIRPAVEGINIDFDKLENLYLTKQQELLAVINEMKEMISKLPNKPIFGKKDEFNPGSTVHLLQALAAFGIHVNSTDKETLAQMLLDHPIPFVYKLKEFKTLFSQVTKQMKSWIERDVDRSNGDIIHTNIKPYGSDSGRLASSEPNMMQVTADLRSMIVARPGYKIFKADYSAFEFRACAGLTKEPYLLDAYSIRSKLLPSMKEMVRTYGYTDPDDFVKDVGKKKVTVSLADYDLLDTFRNTDIHLKNASLVSGVPIPELTPANRDVGKCVALDTYIHTNKGVMQIGRLLPNKPRVGEYYPLKGIKILTDVGYKDAPTIYYNGKSKAIRITTRSGRSITCSPIHQFRSIKKGEYAWVKADKLKVGQEVFIKLNGNISTKTNKIGIDMEPVQLVRLLCLYIKYGREEDGKLFFPIEYKEQISELVTSKFYTKKFEFWFEADKIVLDYMNDIIRSQMIPSELLCQSREVIEQLVLGLSSISNTGLTWSYGPEMIRQIQNLLTQLGINSFNYENTLRVYGHYAQSLEKAINGTPIINPGYDKNSLDCWKAHGSLAVHEKIADAQLDMNVQNFESVKQVLSESELKQGEFFIENHLIRDEIVSIQHLGMVDMCDVTVPDNHTVVAEGLVTHNTLGYSFLYGAGAKRIREALAPKGIYYTDDEAQKLIDKFFDKLPLVKELIDKTHKDVVDKGYYTTLMGRKRFFDLGPKYRAREWERNRMAACRAATNGLFQSANADATKKAMVDINAAFEAMYDEQIRPRFLLVVHDEIVYEIHESIVEEAGKIITDLMIEAGRMATGYTVPIETSAAINSAWSK